MVIAPPEGAYFSSRYDPVWTVMQANGLLAAMHVGSGRGRGSVDALTAVSFLSPTNVQRWPEGHPDHLKAIVVRKTTLGGFGGYGDAALETLPALIGGGVLERFPDLHFLIAEVGARWLLNFMDTMDEAWYVGPGVQEVNRTFFKPDGTHITQFLPDELGLEWPHPLKPSEYVRRQVHVTFQDDWVALRNRVLTGIEPLVWGNDYPHFEGCWPDSDEAIAAQCEKAGVTAEERDAIFGGTARHLLGLGHLDSVGTQG